MIKAQKVLLQFSVLLPVSDVDTVSLDGLSVADAISLVEANGGTVSTVEVASSDSVDTLEAAAAVIQSGADMTPFVDVEQMVDPQPIVRTSASPDGQGWIATWSFPGTAETTLPLVFPSEPDAQSIAQRHALASRDPEAEADEFDETFHLDPFDREIHYSALFLDEENRWRGRWYRNEWASEGQYTDSLYDTPGQARRAARRLRNTGDEM